MDSAIEDDIRRIDNDIQEFERRRAEVGRLAQAAEQKRKNLDVSLPRAFIP
jgi:hypothetical protein